jgi:TRAP-type uncharacterized transport system substrate-binding protein
VIAPKVLVSKAFARLNALFGQGLIVSLTVILVIGVAAGAALLLFANTAAPTTVTMASGPTGSVFQRNAERYQKILAREGVTLKIVPSDGSKDNLRMLTDPKSDVDVGFVLGGETKANEIGNLMSLGSVAYQPLMVFYRGTPKDLLSDFAGKRIDIGEEGSGTHTLALALLKANGIEPGGSTTLATRESTDAAQALAEGKTDAIFLMGESTPTDLMRKLLRDPEIHLFNFTQADAYSRRITYLNKLTLPKGALDFGKNIPAEDTYLIGPTVELVARSSLHPALSDLLLEAAREIHGRAGLYRKRGEFPAAVENDIRLSPEAVRYYASGKSFLYRTFPFWLASLIARALAVIVPLALLLIPALKLAPTIYRWRMESRIRRWYRALQELEREAFAPACDATRREELLRQLDEVEDKVTQIVVPPAFGDVLYGLRTHIGFVRERLRSQPALMVDRNDDARRVAA